MNLQERVKGILVDAKHEWPIIATETGDATYLFTNYVAILAAIPAVARFIGMVIGGVGFLRSLIFAIFAYAVYCASWYVMALVIDALAPTFGGQKSMPNALKVSAYASTAAWLAGVFSIIPMLAFLGILGLYSLYLLYTGLPVLMKSPQDKTIGYTAAVVVIVFVVVAVLMFILGTIVLMRAF